MAPKLSVVGADRLPRPALAFLGRDAPGPEAGPPAGSLTPAGDGSALYHGVLDVAPSGASGSPAHPHDAYARHRIRRRRRDTLGVLTLFFTTTVLIGFIPGAGVAWALSLVSGVALAAYVALLVRMRQMAEERERKLYYLHPGAGTPALEGTRGSELGQLGGIPYGVTDLPVRMSGRYAHPSNQAAMAH
jgi:hypothetical protein